MYLNTSSIYLFSWQFVFCSNIENCSVEKLLELVWIVFLALMEKAVCKVVISVLVNKGRSFLSLRTS